MRKLQQLALVTAVASTTMGVGSQALGAIGLEEIVVTARKREEAIQDVPVAVTAVTGETFDRSMLLNFEEATALTPGFSVPPTSTSPLALALSMRGSVQTDSIVTMDPSVGVYVDGVYIARSYGIGVDLVDLQDIQVLKGPQGTLFGRNSTAGAMLLNSKNPELEEFSGSLGLSGGPDYQKYTGILNVPMGEMFALRVALQQAERDDYVTNAANPSKPSVSELGGKETETVRAKLRFAPTDALDMVLSWEKFDADVSGPASDQLWRSGVAIPFDRDDDTVSLSFDPFNSAETETLTFVATYSLDIGDIKFLASDREWRHLREIDYDGGDFASRITRHGSWGREAGDQKSYELQFNTSLFEDRIDLVAGVMYFEEFAQLYDYSYGLNAFTKPPATVVGGAYVENNVESLGFYGQATWHINEVSNLTLGLRKTEDEKTGGVWGSSSQSRTNRYPSWDFDAHKNSMVIAGTTTPVPVLRPNETFDSTDWLISYDYKLSDAIMVYGKASTGFRAGGFNGRGVPAGVPFTYEPEEILEYELGLKGDFLEDTLRWNTAFYTNETTDKQYTTIFADQTTQTSATAVLNAGTTESKGLETELTYLLHENWSIAATYAYIDSEFTELESGGMKVPDEELPITQFVPENQWSLSLNYDQEFSALRLSGTATYYWVDEMLGNDESAASIVAESANLGVAALTPAMAESFIDASTTDAYGLLNLNLTASTLDDKYSASLWVKNALDERKVQSTIGFISGQVYQYVRGTYTEPRMWGVTLNASF